jgi:hypothetical protein
MHANEILGEKAFNTEDWRVIGEYVYDDQGGRHQAFYSPIKDVHYKDIHFKAGERVQMEQSLKYSPEQAQDLWQVSGLNEARRWSASSEVYSTSRLLFAPCFFVPRSWSMRLLCPISVSRWRSHGHTSTDRVGVPMGGLQVPAVDFS